MDWCELCRWYAADAPPLVRGLVGGLIGVVGIQALIFGTLVWWQKHHE